MVADDSEKDGNEHKKLCQEIHPHLNPPVGRKSRVVDADAPVDETMRVFAVFLEGLEGPDGRRPLIGVLIEAAHEGPALVVQSSELDRGPCEVELNFALLWRMKHT